MAFAAVNSLVETLEDLLSFTCLSIEISTKFQTHRKVLRPVRLMPLQGMPVRRMPVQGMPVKGMPGMPVRFILSGSFRNVVQRVTEDLLRNWPEMPMKYLLSSPRDLKMRCFLNLRAIEMSDLCRSLCFLLIFLVDSASICNDHEKIKYLEGSLVDMAYRIEDTIQESVFDRSIYSSAFDFIDGVLKNDPEIVEGQIPFISEVLEMFDKSFGIPLNLQQMQQEIDLIKKEVRKIYDQTQIVTENLQIGESTEIVDTLQHLQTKNKVFDIDDNGFLSVLDRVIRMASPLEMVAIVGMGGIGKTTLAQRVFGYSLTCHHFYIRAWVTLTQVYRVRDVLVGLLSCIVQTTDEIYAKSREQLAEDLYRSLKGKRFLIVLDNIWSAKAWDDVKRCFPDDKNGSRIILTTRLIEVADYVNPKQPPHCVNLLDIEQSWKLLQLKVFGEELCPLELEDVGRRIARKCQGLPLAIVAVAGILCEIMQTRDSWERIAESVNSVVCSYPEQCLEILALSYKHLPSHLKACFLYLGTFPEDCEIEVKKVISLWIAEGFLHKKLPSSSESCRNDLLDVCNRKSLTYLHWRHSQYRLEFEAEACLEDLIRRNLVLVGKRGFSGKIKTCRLHDLIRELCLREAQKEKFMHVIRRDYEAFHASTSLERRLSIQSNFWGSLDSVDPMPFVRSFLCFSLGFGIIPDTIFSQLEFKLLRVLDISFLRLQHFPVQILKLVHLRYLAFTATFELPISIFELRNLRTLIIHGPWIRREDQRNSNLLLKYWNMPWLRHLKTTVACSLINPFIDIKNLLYPFHPMYLQNLSTVTFSSCSAEVFSLMPNLKELGISESEEDYRTDSSCKWLSNLVHLGNLESLKCSFYVQSGNRRNSLDGVFPSSIKKLTLSWSYIPWENMTSVAMLPNLEVLKLKNNAFRGPEWEPSEEGFRRLKHLLIENHDLVHFDASSIHFPCLEHLALRSCKSLEEIPFGVAEIATLQLLELHYCSKSAENSAKEIQEQVDDLNVDIRSNA